MIRLRTLCMLGLAVLSAASSPAPGAQGFLERYGAPSTWGALGTRAHLERLEAILADRAQYALSIPRTDVYVLAHPSGNASGGGGAGTQASPYLVATSDDLRAFLYARAAPNTAFRLKGEFRSSGPGGLGLHIGTDGIALRRWPGETRRWMVSAFTPAYGSAGWTAQDLGDSTLYTRHEPEPVYWIKTGITDADVDRYPCRKASSLADLQEGIEGELSEWFHDSATQTLYVHLPNALIAGGHVSIETVEPMKHAVNGPDLVRSGIRVSDADGVLIDGGLVEGFGFDTQWNGTWPITIDCIGTNLQHVHDTKVRFGWYHTLGGLSGSGGIRVYTDVELGYCRPAPAEIPGGGNFTTFVDFATVGGHEVYIDGMSIINGTLPDDDFPGPRTGTPIYAHTIGYQTPGALSIRRGVRIRDNPLSGFADMQQFGDFPGPAPGASARRSPGSYRSFVLDEAVRLTEVTRNDSLSFAQSRGVYYNCRWSVSCKPPEAQTHRRLISGPVRGHFLNCELEMRAQAGAWNDSTLTLFSAGAGTAPGTAHDCDWVHSRWGIRLDPGAVGVAGRTVSSSGEPSWAANACGWFSSLFSAELSGQVLLGLPTGNPAAGPGSAGSAYSSAPGGGIPATEFFGNPSSIAVPSVMDFENGNEIPPELIVASRFPPGTFAEFDALRSDRASLAAPGPIAPAVSGSCCTGSACSVVMNHECAQEGAYFRPGGACPPGPEGVCCAADFNGDFVVDATDLFVFLDAWFANVAGHGGQSADIDRSGAVDATDIFIYLDAWFRRCP